MNIIILVGDTGTNAVFQTLAEAVSSDIKGVWVKNANNEVAQIAEAFDIPVTHNLSDLLNVNNIDLIVDLSGSEDVAAEISEHRTNAEVVDHSSARLICRLLESEGRKTYDLIDELTREHWALYEIGTSLSSAKDLSDVYKVIVRQATKLTNTPVGSLAVYDEETREMHFTASTGFRGEIAPQDSWTLRTGGLTSYILGQKDAVAISNIDDYPQFNNPQLIKEGIKSLIACPLVFDSRVIGIIYVDDFRVRDFTERDISILSLLSTYAV